MVQFTRFFVRVHCLPSHSVSAVETVCERDWIAAVICNQTVLLFCRVRRACCNCPPKTFLRPCRSASVLHSHRCALLKGEGRPSPTSTARLLALPSLSLQLRLFRLPTLEPTLTQQPTTTLV